MVEPQEPSLVELSDGLKHPAPVHAQAFLGLVRAGEALERGLDAELKMAHGISLRGFEVLLHLGVFAPDGRLRMTKLTEQAPLSQSRVSRLVAELESRGLVTRSADETDSRGVTVAITARGLDKLREAQGTHFSGLETRLFSRLSWDEIQQLAHLTGKIMAADEC